MSCKTGLLNVELDVITPLAKLTATFLLKKQGDQGAPDGFFVLQLRNGLETCLVFG